MNESRRRLLSELSSSIFSLPKETHHLTPKPSLFYRNSSFTNPRLNLNSISVNKPPALNPSATPRSLSRDEMLTPRQRKQYELNVFPGEEFPKPDQVKIETIQVTGLKPHDNESVLKTIAQKYHVIEVKTEFDNLKGVCTGNGKIVIRSSQNKNEKEELVFKLKNRGFDVKEGNKITAKPRISQEFTNFDIGLRNNKALGKFQVFKENSDRSSTPRYMRHTTSSSKKLL